LCWLFLRWGPLSGLKLQSSWSLPPESLGLQEWATSSQLAFSSCFQQPRKNHGFQGFILFFTCKTLQQQQWAK
jgi:hypothetical protein